MFLGGPGGASTDFAGWLPQQPFTQVFIDQRGTGFATAEADCPEFDDAKLQELTGLLDMGSVEVVDRPPGCHEIGTRWVCTYKKDAAGVILRAKARLVAKGFQDPERGTFVTEVATPTKETTRSVLWISVELQWEVRKEDLKQAFLHSEELQNMS